MSDEVTKNAINNAEIKQKRIIGRPFKKGEIPNPNGRPKGSVNEVTKFKEAIALFEKEQNKSIYAFMLEKSLRNPQILIAIFKALVPQQQQTEITTPESMEIIVKHVDEK